MMMMISDPPMSGKCPQRDKGGVRDSLDEKGGFLLTWEGEKLNEPSLEVAARRV